MKVFLKMYGSDETESSCTDPLGFFKIMRDTTEPGSEYDYGMRESGKLIIATTNQEQRKNGWLHGRINSRATMAALIAEKQVDGMIWLQSGGYDHVDHVRWADKPRRVSVVKFWRDSIRFILGADDWMHDGECSHWTNPLSVQEAEACEPEHRDLAMEAFENGHPYSIRG